MDRFWTLKKEEYRIAPSFWARMKQHLTELGNNLVRDAGSIPGLGRSPGGGHGNPLQYSCLENPMDRGAWRATAHRVTKSRIWLKRVGMHTPRSYDFFLNSKGYCEITYHYESEGISSRTGHPALAHAMEPLRCSQTSYRGCGYLGRFPREGYASSRTWRTTMQRPPWQSQKMNECEFQPSVINMEGFGGSQYRVLMRK